MSYRLIDANALNNKISTEDYEIIMKEPEVFADIPNGMDGGFYIAVPATEGMTNGDMIKAIFPNCEQKEHMNNGYFEMYFDDDLRDASYMRVSKDWWNAPY